MTWRSGLGIVDVAALQALHTIGARPDRPRIKAARLVPVVDDATGLGPDPSFDLLLNQARPWVVPIPLVDFHGNIGSPDDEAAAPRYIEARLSPAGQAVLDAETGAIAPVPVGLITGNTHRGGSRPPFAPDRMIAALQHLGAHPATTDAELIETVGPPRFPGGCDIDGALDDLIAGHPCAVTLRARTTIHAGNPTRITIERFPPQVRPQDIVAAISPRHDYRPWTQNHPELAHYTSNPFAQIYDPVGYHHLDTKIECVAKADVTTSDIQRFLRIVWPLSTNLVLELAAPLPALLRYWVAAAQHEDISTSLTNLDQTL